MNEPLRVNNASARCFGARRTDEVSARRETLSTQYLLGTASGAVTSVLVSALALALASPVLALALVLASALALVA